MPVSLFVILSILIAGILGLAGIYLLFKVISNFQPGNNRVLEDLKKMKAEIADWTGALVDWNQEEMELLSLRQVNQKIKKGIGKTAKGVFTSIYHEPLIAYNYRQYLGGKGKNAILYARTSKDEFAYRIKPKSVLINVNNEYLGELKENGGLYGGRRKRLMARINRDDELQLNPIIVGEKEVASVANPSRSNKFNPRAFEFLTPMKAEEEKVFMSLAILEMVNDSIRH